MVLQSLLSEALVDYPLSTWIGGGFQKFQTLL